MNRSENRAKAASAAIAQVRNSLSSFTIPELIKSLKSFGCPYALDVSRVLIGKNIILKKGKNYSFSNTEPVHYKVLMPTLDNIAKNVKKYTEKYYLKQTPSVSLEMSEEEMIAALKLKGYRILKPITKFEEC